MSSVILLCSALLGVAVLEGSQPVNLCKYWYDPHASCEMAAETIRTSVIGVGESRSKARAVAERSARQVAGGRYTVVSVRYEGIDNSYVCILVIEYRK